MVNEVPRVGGQIRTVARQLNGTAATRKSEFVVKRHGMHDGFQFVETIGAFAENVQQEIDLAGRTLLQRLIENAEAAARNFRKNIAAAEAQRAVGGLKNGVGDGARGEVQRERLDIAHKRDGAVRGRSHAPPR